MKDFTVTLTTAMLKQWNLQHLVMLFSLRLLLLLFSLINVIYCGQISRQKIFIGKGNISTLRENLPAVSRKLSKFKQ